MVIPQKLADRISQYTTQCMQSSNYPILNYSSVIFFVYKFFCEK